MMMIKGFDRALAYLRDNNSNFTRPAHNVLFCLPSPARGERGGGEGCHSAPASAPKSFNQLGVAQRFKLCIGRRSGMNTKNNILIENAQLRHRPHICHSEPATAHSAEAPAKPALERSQGNPPESQR